MKTDLLRSAALLVPVALAACSQPQAFLAVGGPAVTLTAEAPAVEFEVTLCLERSAEDVSWASSSVQVELASAVGGGQETVRGSAPGSADDTGTDELGVDDFGDMGLGFTLDVGQEWYGGGGRRCSEPQMVRLEVLDADAETVIDLDWEVHMNASNNPGLFGSTLSSEDLSVEIEPL